MLTSFFGITTGRSFQQLLARLVFNGEFLEFFQNVFEPACTVHSLFLSPGLGITTLAILFGTVITVTYGMSASPTTLFTFGLAFAASSTSCREASKGILIRSRSFPFT